MTLYLAYIAMGFIILQFINVLLNLFFRQKIHKNTLPLQKSLSILIPARNEAENIGFLLDDLIQINHQQLEIIVFDDQSTDDTYSIVQQYAKSNKRIKILQSKGLPKGWLGKNHACYQLAKVAKGDYFLFLDADVRLHDNLAQDVVGYLDKYQLGLLSIFPLQLQKTIGEKISVPMMNYILLTLLPLIFVRISPFTSHSAANGQFMLFNANTYKAHQPHKLFKNKAVEDIVISRYFKKKNIKIACITSEKRIQCRMYKNYREALNGFSKNIFMFFGNNIILAFLFGTFVTLGFIPILIALPHLLWIYFSILLVILLSYAYISQQNMVLNVLLFPLQLLFLYQVMLKSLVNKKYKKYSSWKGRNIYS